MTRERISDLECFFRAGRRAQTVLVNCRTPLQRQVLKLSYTYGSGMIKRAEWHHAGITPRAYDK